MDPEIVDLSRIILDRVPTCPVCGEPIHISEECCIAVYENVLFLIHYECGDMQYFNA